MKGITLTLFLAATVCLVSAAVHHQHEKKHHASKKHHLTHKRHHLKRDGGSTCTICPYYCYDGCTITLPDDCQNDNNRSNQLKKKSLHVKRDEDGITVGDSEGATPPYADDGSNGTDNPNNSDFYECCQCNCPDDDDNGDNNGNDGNNDGDNDNEATTTESQNGTDDKKRSKHVSKKHKAKKHH